MSNIYALDLWTQTECLAGQALMKLSLVILMLFGVFEIHFSIDYCCFLYVCILYLSKTKQELMNFVHDFSMDDFNIGLEPDAN